MNHTSFRNHLDRSRLSRRRLLGGAAVGGASLAAAVIGCGGGEKEEAGAKPEGGGAAAVKHGSINYGTGSTGQSLSPNAAVVSGNPEFQGIFDALTRLNGKGELEPSLATKWEPDPKDKRRWVFYLRDAEWSDGKPFTAEDVKFTFDYIADSKTKSAVITRVSSVDAVEIVDKKTVAIINKSTGDPIMPRRSTEILIQPKHYIGDPAFGDQAQATKPIGTGAYLVDEYARDSRIKLKLNPNSWRGTKGVDAANILVLRDNQTRLAAFESADLDIAGVPLPDIDRVRAQKNVTVTRGIPLGYNGWDLEYFDPPVSDVRVRLAINHAVDMDQIAKTVFFGLPKPMTQALTESTFGYNPNIKGYKFDPDLARKLLKEAGVDKLTFKMEYKSGHGTQSPEFAAATADYLKDVGLGTELIPLEINVWRDRLYGRAKRAPMMNNTWAATAVRDASFVFVWFLSNDPSDHYDRKDFDDLYNAAVQEFDEEKRKQLWWKIGDMFYDDPPNNWGVEGASGGSAHRTDKIKEFDEANFLNTFVLA